MNRKKLSKILLVIFLIVTFVLNPIGTSIAWGKENSEKYKNYVNDSVYYCLSAAGLDMSHYYYISNSFEIQNGIRDERMAFVFSGHECVGELWINADKESYAFFREKCNEITNILEDKAEVAVIRKDFEHIYIIRSDRESMFCIYGVAEKNENLEFTPRHYNRIILNRINLPETSENSGNRGVIDESHYINVPLQATATSPDTNKGLCWVACILSMLRNSGLTTITTTLGLYNDIKTHFSPSIYGFPIGNSSWISGTFVTYNYSITDYDNNSGLNFNTVKGIINSDKPIYASLDYFGSTTTHAVVLCGYSHFSNTGLTHYRYYRLMDPDASSSYVTVSAPATGTDFTYGNFTDWFRYYY